MAAAYPVKSIGHDPAHMVQEYVFHPDHPVAARVLIKDPSEVPPVVSTRADMEQYGNRPQ